MLVMVTNKIYPGYRHNALYEKASALQKEGATVVQIETTIRLMNLEQCEPPIKESRIKDLMNTVKKWFNK